MITNKLPLLILASTLHRGHEFAKRMNYHPSEIFVIRNENHLYGIGRGRLLVKLNGWRCGYADVQKIEDMIAMRECVVYDEFEFINGGMSTMSDNIPNLENTSVVGIDKSNGIDYTVETKIVRDKFGNMKIIESKIFKNEETTND